MEVNILMPVYNIKIEDIDKTIQSVLEQTYEEFTFLIVDDYSTNNTIHILNYYKKLDKRIKVIHSTGKKGIVGALNEGIAKCDEDCKYIVRIDSGDICMSNRVEEQKGFMDENLEYGLTGTQFEVYSKNGDLSSGILRFQNYSNKFYEFEDIKNNFTVMAMLAHSTFMLRKSIMDKIDVYSDKYDAAEDYELVKRIINNGYKVYKIPKILVKYEFDETGGISNEKRITQVKSSIRIKLEYVFELFIKNNKLRNAVIWGTKDFAGYLEEELRNPVYNLKVLCFTDFDKDVWRMKKNSLPIISPGEMVKKLSEDDIVIVMWNLDRDKIVNFLEEHGLIKNKNFFVFS